MDFKTVAINVAKEVGVELLELLKGEIQFTYKGPIDIQAEGDLLSEAIITKRIRENFPDHSILAEESGKDEITSDYLWVVDPIDGTMNFSRKRDDFAVSIALTYKGEVILGVAYQPTLDRLYYAEKGKGAFLNGEKINVSQYDDLKLFILESGDPYTVEERKKSMLLTQKLAHTFRSLRKGHGAVVRFMAVAQGHIDVGYSPILHYWDFAASMLIVTEAGGMATDLQGNPLTSESRSCIMSNGKKHDELLKLIGSK